MPPTVFDELFDVVCDHIPDTMPVVPHHRQYSKRTKLLVTLYYLAHVPTLRCMSRLFGVPHNSISEVCLGPGLTALEQALCDSPDTKTVRFPRIAADLRKTMRQFSSKWHLPVVGAVDGCLIPQRKPSSSQAGGDADAFWSYKGSPASLLLAICDAKGRFLYVNVGAPGSVGDARLWARSDLCSRIEGGMLDIAGVELSDGEETRMIRPVLVGDAAFPLGPHMMKIYDEPGPNGMPEFRASGKATFNRCVINCRREIERTFGRLKGRWAFCRRNTFVQSPQFVRSAVRVCCALHNFIEERHVDYDIGWQHEGPEAPVPNIAPIPAAQQGVVGRNAEGRAVRDFLTRYVSTLE